MSDPIDDEAFEEYLKGGSVVSQRYRELGADEVPDEVNRHVLDQARAAVGKRPAKSPTWMRWSAPLALAASAVLVLSIVIDSGMEPEVVLAPQSPPPAPDGVMNDKTEGASGTIADLPNEAEQPAPPAAAPPSEAPATIAQRKSARRMHEKKKESAASEEELRERAPAAYALNTEVAAASPPPPTAAIEARAEPQPVSPSPEVQQSNSVARLKQATDSLEEVAIVGRHRRDAAGARAGPRGTVPARSADVSADADDAEIDSPRTYSDPERWLQDIRQLRKDGKTAEADREWQRFRAAFPNHPVADTDLAKK